MLKSFINHRGYIIYGIYNAIIEYKKEIACLFRYNKHNKYTHIDLARTKDLGLQINLIQDGTSNALVYEKKTRISGEVIFGEYVNFLFRLKNTKEIISRVAKKILNILWEALCQRNRSYYDVSSYSSIPFEFPKGKIFNNITPIDDNNWVFQFSNPENLFKSEY